MRRRAKPKVVGTVRAVIRLINLWVGSIVLFRGVLIALLLVFAVAILRADVGSIAVSWSLTNKVEDIEDGQESR